MAALVQLLVDNIVLTIVVFVSVIFLVAFIYRFVFPAIRLYSGLRKAKLQLKALKPASSATGDIVRTITDQIFIDSAMREAWTEYLKTLHRQQGLSNDPLIPASVTYRATALSEIAFDDQVIIDVAIDSELFKHLPGILTGFGIIATFTGLINGLRGFSATTEAAKAQSQLQSLIASVGNAFIFSSAAISAAIIVTIVEKLCYSACAGALARVRYEIDRIFEVGASEEYLASLSQSSLNTETHIAHIKSHLIADLQVMLQTLLDNQKLAEDTRTEQMPHQIGQAIASQLGEPISAIADAVKNVTAHQGNAVNDMLTDVLTRFSNRIEQMFGDQLASVASLLNQTAETMREATDQFTDLATKIGSAGGDAVDTMGRRLEIIMTDLQSKQNDANGQMMVFLDSMRSIIATTQQETTSSTADLLGQLSARMDGIITAADERNSAMNTAQNQAHGRLEEHTSDVLTKLSSSFSQSVELSGQTHDLLANILERLTATTDRAISGINSGAVGLQAAIGEMSTAHRDLAQTLSGASQLTNDLRAAATSLNSSTASIGSMLTDYAQSRDQIAKMVTELREIINIAKRDAAMNSELTGRLENAAARLGEAKDQAATYLTGINNALTEAHESFATAIQRTLQSSNAQFNQELRQLVSLVQGLISDVEDKVLMMGDAR